VSLPIDAYLQLGHRFQQCCLGLRRGPVDLVGQQQVGEDRAGPEHQLAAALVVQRSSGHVGREQIRGELDAGEVQP
jgi:hypothetical protein